jgi:hypothetical protein
LDHVLGFLQQWIDELESGDESSTNDWVADDDDLPSSMPAILAAKTSASCSIFSSISSSVDEASPIMSVI